VCVGGVGGKGHCNLLQQMLDKSWAICLDPPNMVGTSKRLYLGGEGGGGSRAATDVNLYFLLCIEALGTK
jgi:hypothetical protein